MTVISGVDRSVLGQRLEVELERFVDSNPRSKELYERAQKSLVGGVPMPWMMRATRITGNAWPTIMVSEPSTASATAARNRTRCWRGRLTSAMR